MSIRYCDVRPLFSVTLLAACFVFPVATNAQEISIEGVARSASLFSALVSQCQKSYFINVEEAKKYRAVFVESGTKMIGQKKFEGLLAKEMKRRLAEVKVTGQVQWCSYQKNNIVQMGVGKVFEKPVAKNAVSPDDMATAVASLVIAQHHCGLEVADIPLNAVFAKRGLDPKAFLPDGAYASDIEIKMKRSEEFIEMLGLEKACEAISDTVRQFLPELVQTEDKKI